MPEKITRALICFRDDEAQETLESDTAAALINCMTTLDNIYGGGWNLSPVAYTPGEGGGLAEIISLRIKRL